jgi:SAM-dependent methyltransferase
MSVSKVEIVRRVLRSHGVAGTAAAIFRELSFRKAKSLPICKALVAGRRGLEIGGPSQIFTRRGLLPIYPLAASLDNCNFNSKTIWQPSAVEGHTFRYEKKCPVGFQYIAEATNLEMIGSGSYEFILSSHSIEHTANPLRALREWMRVVAEGGGLLLVVPHKEGTFDHHRPTTTLPHLIGDFERNTEEDDQTHLSEVLELYDIDREWGSPDFAAFKERALKNSENRALHHHVFDTELVVRMLHHVGWQILSVEALKPFQIIIAAQKVPQAASLQNNQFLSANADWRHKSPFQADRGRAGKNHTINNKNINASGK